MQNHVFSISQLSDEYLEKAWQLNQAEYPKLGNVSFEQFQMLKSMCCAAWIAKHHEHFAGFFMAMPAGVQYNSDNYQWFLANRKNFIYVDRLAISPQFRGQGLGKLFYNQLISQWRHRVCEIACEVNLQPSNPESLAFHHKLGFIEVGQLHSANNNKCVSLLIRQLNNEVKVKNVS